MRSSTVPRVTKGRSGLRRLLDAVASEKPSPTIPREWRKISGGRSWVSLGSRIVVGESGIPFSPTPTVRSKVGEMC